MESLRETTTTTVGFHYLADARQWLDVRFGGVVIGEANNGVRDWAAKREACWGRIARARTAGAIATEVHAEVIVEVTQELAGYGGDANRRKTHCRHGHALTDENVYAPPANPTWRQCRTCKRAGSRRAKAKHKRGASAGLGGAL